MEKAMKVSASTRRSHAALRAVTPAHGNGDASSYFTAVVSPILNDSIFPTERQTSCLRSKNGARMKPATGSPRIRAPIPLRERLRRARNFRRQSSAGEQGQPVEVFSVFGSLMANVSNPSSYGYDKQHDTDAGYYQ
jgi:hypothetical protein